MGRVNFSALNGLRCIFERSKQTTITRSDLRVKTSYVILIAMAVLSISASATAIEVLSVDVEIKDNLYQLHGQSIINAPADFIFNILMDYDNFHRITGGIADSRLLDPEDDGVLLGYTRVDSCVWVFCRQFEKVERIHATPTREIITEAVPEKSDFTVNRTRWILENVEGGTLVTYQAEMDPDFWIPPLIGPWALKKKLWLSAEQIGERIEYLLASGRSLSEFGN